MMLAKVLLVFVTLLPSATATESENAGSENNAEGGGLRGAKCEKLFDKCISCTPGFKACEECKADYVLQDGMCVDIVGTCADLFNNLNCEACNDMECTKCKEGSYFASGGTCVITGADCDNEFPNCDQCHQTVLGLGTICNACKSGFWKDFDNDKGEAVCMEISSTCDDPNCMECTVQQCVKCDEGFQILPGNTSCFPNII